MDLHGDHLDRASLLARVGRVEQVAGVSHLVCDEGEGRGVRIMRVTSGGGLDFDVLVDRAFDIWRASFAGIPLAWLSPVGPAGPAAYDPVGDGWLRGWGGGLLTTCGLQSIGSPSHDAGRDWGLHGEISYRPARDAAWRLDWSGGGEAVVLQASISEVAAPGGHLQLDRTYRVPIGGRRIELTDVLTNHGERPVEYQVLYHVNLGYPLLAETTRLTFPAGDQATGRDAASEAALADHASGAAPDPAGEDQVFRHTAPPDASGWVRVAISRPDLGHDGVTLRLSYRAAELPLLWQWRMLRSGSYVMGIEPATGLLAGRAASRAAGLLASLAPAESVEFRVDFEAADGAMNATGATGAPGPQ